MPIHCSVHDLRTYRIVSPYLHLLHHFAHVRAEGQVDTNCVLHLLRHLGHFLADGVDDEVRESPVHVGVRNHCVVLAGANDCVLQARIRVVRSLPLKGRRAFPAMIISSN